MTNNEKFIITGVLCATILIMTILIVITVRKAIYNRAVTECAQISTVSFTNADGAKITQPVQTQFEDCLKRKGY